MTFHFELLPQAYTYMHHHRKHRCTPHFARLCQQVYFVIFFAALIWLPRIWFCWYIFHACNKNEWEGKSSYLDVCVCSSRTQKIHARNPNRTKSKTLTLRRKYIEVKNTWKEWSCQPKFLLFINISSQSIFRSVTLPQSTISH